MLDFIAPLLLIGVVFVGLAGAGYAWSQQADAHALALLRRMPTTPAAQVREGEHVKVIGTVESRPATLVAPLTDRLCVYYRLIIEEGSRKRWSTLLRQECGVDFWLRDDSGSVLVQPGENAAVTILMQWEQERMISHWQQDDRLHRLLLANGLPTRGGFFDPTVRARETVIMARHRVAVSGRARSEADPEALTVGYRETARRTILAPGDVPLVMSDEELAYVPR